MSSQSTLDKYYSKKGIQPKTQIYYKGVIREERRKDPGSRQGSDDQTQLINQDTQQRTKVADIRNYPVCPLFFVITPELTTRKEAVLSKFTALAKSPSPKYDILAFIKGQIKSTVKASSVDKINIRNLEKVASERFWTKALPVALRRVVEYSSKRKPSAIRILQQNCNSSVEITRQQAYILLTHMFMCTLPPQFYRTDCTFSFLYGSFNQSSDCKYEKVRCIVAYFQEMMQCRQFEFEEKIVFQRYFQPSKQYVQKKLTMSFVDFSFKNIQSYKGEMLVDFANKNIGGGVLKTGCVQEEILFLTHPQALISCYLFQTLGDKECAFIQGCRQFSRYEGYSSSFKFVSNHRDVAKVDKYSKHPNTFIVIDAINFNQGILKSNPSCQYQKIHVSRQLHKAYIGFSGCQQIQQDFDEKKRVITGKWGCGAFGGNVELKFIIQWLACSLAQRDMVFVMWGEDTKQVEDSPVKQMYQALKLYTTLDVYQMLKKYIQFVQRESVTLGFCDYICDFYLPVTQ